jgi:hypothetical protein
LSGIFGRIEAMGVDRKARDDLRSALVRYMTGEMRSFEFDDQTSPFQSAKATSDESIRRISRELWTIYDDLIDHPISVTPEGWAALRRILAFLQTDLEIEKTRDRDTWPFHDHEEWLQNERVLNDVDLPEYDPTIHGRPANPWWNRISSVVGFVILGCLLAVVLILLLLA